MRRLIYLLLALTIAVASPAQNRRSGKATKTTTTRKAGNSRKSGKSGGNQRQNNRSSRQMKDDRDKVQQQMQKNQQKLRANRQEQENKTRLIAQIDEQMRQRADHIHTLEQRIDTVEMEVDRLQSHFDSLTTQLNQKKERYAQALRYARHQRLNLPPTVFALAGSTPTEMVRRARYAQLYATYQQQLGESVVTQRTEVQNAQSDLLAKKDTLNAALQEIRLQRQQLANEQRRQQDILNGLVRVQQDIDKELQKQQKQIDELNLEIERQVAREIELARRQAEERQRREAEERRKAEERRRRQNQGSRTGSNNNRNNSGGNRGNSNNNRGNSNNSRSNSSGSRSNSGNNSGSTWMTNDDRALTGSFVQNKGRLPVPITGNYRITCNFGPYTPAGTKGVTLNSKGISYTGQQGARARVIFDGIVSAVVNQGGRQHVLVRHGSYITVYCNLTSVIVRQGQRLKTRDLLGAIVPDDRGQYTVQLQLYKEKTLIDPKPWISR